MTLGQASAAAAPRGRGSASLRANLGGGVVRVVAVTADVLRIRWSVDGRGLPRRSWAATPPDEAFATPSAESSADGRSARLATDALVAEIDSGRLVISSTEGRVLMRDGDAGGPRLATEGPRRAIWTHDMPVDRRYVGFGERTGTLDKLGRRYTCWTTDEWRHQGPSTDMLYVAIPYFMAVDPDGSAFGVLLNATQRSAFDLTGLDGRTMSMEVESPELDWYLIHGPRPRDVVERLTALVGRPMLPPRWALGYHQARWSYESAVEVRSIAEQLRTNRIPADVITLDIDHLDGFRVFTWDRTAFPDPARLIADLGELGFRATAIVDAAVKREPGYDVYDDGHRRGFFVRTSSEEDAPELIGELWAGPSVYPDHTRPDVREWWGNLYRRYLDVGVAGFLNDMNEPAMHDRPIDDPRTANIEPSPETPFGPPAERATHAEVRNVYAVLENQATVEGLRRARPEVRPFVLTRAGHTGVQRDAGVWTGDNSSSWEDLRTSLAQILNLGLSGVAVAGADIGGFFLDCTPELLVRWAQLGAFYPVARNNSARGTARQEPWVWGEPTTSRYRRAIELRYRLLPVLYTLVWEATRTGLPPLRPLLLEWPSDPIAAGIEDEALLGADVLIAPVLEPGHSARAVYLPAAGWFDLRTFTHHRGPGYTTASATLDEDLPIFARAGSILPLGPVMAWTGERPVDPLTLHVFPDEEGRASGVLYEDDGVSMAYRDGESSVTRFAAEIDSNETLVVSAERAGAFQPPRRRVDVVAHLPVGERRVEVQEAGSWEVRFANAGGG